MAEPLIQVLMRRDGLSKEEALRQILEARQRVFEGEDPEEILLEEFNLELDYVMDLVL